MELPHDTLARMRMLASLNGLSESDESSAGPVVIDKAIAEPATESK